MAFTQYLNINGENLPLPVDYNVELTDVEADSSGETEAGTKQRDIVRNGIVNISVTFHVSPFWLKKLTGYKKQARLEVLYFDTETLDTRRTQMYIDGFKSGLEKDTSYKGLWNVSFTLKEF